MKISRRNWLATLVGIFSWRRNRDSEGILSPGLISNDDLYALKNIPSRLGKSARSFEELVAADGPLVNSLPGQPLTVDSLRAAFKEFSEQADKPIFIESPTVFIIGPKQKRWFNL